MGRLPRNVVFENATLVMEWDFEKNNSHGLDPQKLGINSHKHAFWICRKCGNEWSAEIKARNRGNGCPACGREQQKLTLNSNLLGKYGSLLDNNPLLAAEWDYPLNSPLTPREVLVNSNKEVFWKCSRCGYRWKQSVLARNQGRGCPACANKVVVPGQNDLATTNPWLSLEWHPSLNGNLTPNQVVAGTQRKAFWRCRICGNEWSASIASRNAGRGCPKCFYSQQVSFQEKAVLFYVRKIYPNAQEGYRPKWLDPKEIDIFIPEYQIGVEYDGAEWHKEPEKDEKKDRLCNEHQITIIHVREPLCPVANLKDFIILNSRSIASLNQGIRALLDLLKERTNSIIPICNIDVQADTIHILEMIQLCAKQKSLSNTYPAISKEWDYEKNYPLTPEQFAPVSGRYVYWKCSLGHQWRARIANRKNGDGCPYCSGKKVLPGFNDLASQKPEIAKEWHPTLNAEKPSEVTAKSNKKVYWQCNKGHTWNASVDARARGRGCPYCSNRKVLKGYNDLASAFPDATAFWDNEKNSPVVPDAVFLNSHKAFWWKCNSCRNEWYMEIRKFTRIKCCPYCNTAQTKK